MIKRYIVPVLAGLVPLSAFAAPSTASIQAVGTAYYNAIEATVLDTAVLAALFAITVGFFAIRWFLRKVRKSAKI